MQKVSPTNDYEICKEDQLEPFIQINTGCSPEKTSEKKVHMKASAGEASFRNFDENEDATKIVSITYLRESKFKCYVIVPILSLCTLFFILLFIYWYPNLRRALCYTKTTMKNATHLFIIG